MFKKKDSISNIMQRGLGFSTKITNNTAKTKNPITIAALVITVTTVILLSSPIVGVITVWADNFFGTSGPDTIVGTGK
jgi:hypothetical protein